MLKIKDNVDLKELEKYGFSYEYNNLVKYICMGRRGQSFYITISNDRIINGYSEGADGDGEESPLDDTLYDLIKDNLVEKVEE